MNKPTARDCDGSLDSREHKGKRRWELSLQGGNKTIITLFHGTRSCKINLNEVHRGEGDSILLSAKICQTLLLPKHIKGYNIRLLNSRNYILGPLVGILVNEVKLKKLLAGNIDAVSRSYARVLRKNRGLAAFFSLRRVFWDSGEVLAVVRTNRAGQEVWVEETLPLPTVVYDRCLGQSGRSQSKVFRNKCALHSSRITVINALPKLGKLEVYRFCSQYPRFAQYLPKWDLLRPDNIEVMLERFPIAYIKPDKLSKGKGVTKVSRTGNGYLVEQSHISTNYQHLCESPQEVLTDLKQYLDTDGYMVIQEAISLITYEGRPFDFSLLLQKDMSGHWKQAGVVGRIMDEGSVISSPRSGGSVATFAQVMSGLSRSERNIIAASMLKLALDLAKTLDELIGPFVELGYDLGVDVTGKVRIIEINGIPLKVSLDRLKDRSITRSVHENPIEYAIFLTGFGRRT